MATKWEAVQASGLPPAPRHNHSCARVGEKLFFFGGSSGGRCLDDLAVYRSRDSSWVATAPRGIVSPTGREGHTAVAAADGKIYIFGGVAADGELLNDVFVLDAVTCTWMALKTAGRVPTPRERHAAVMYGPRMFIFGGHTTDDEAVNDFYGLDVETGIWDGIELRKAPIPRYGHTLSLCGNYMIVLGGKHSGSGLADVCVLDVHSRDGLEFVTPKMNGIAPAGRWGHNTLPLNERMLAVFGGWNGTWCFNDLHVLDCSTWTWTLVTMTDTLPQARSQCSMDLYDDQLFIFGGRCGLRHFNDCYVTSAKSIVQQALNQLGGGNSLVSAGGNSGIRLENLAFKQTLGTGSFGRVKFAFDPVTQKHYAIKILKKAEIIRLKQVDHMISEKEILAVLDHPFIVHLYATFQDPRFLYLVLEYIVGGEFFTHLRKAGKFPNNTARFYAAQIVLIFQYLHSKNIIYRDLKPENLLLDKDGFIKITDFGFAKVVEHRTWTLCGTPEYIAPEILLNKGHGKPVDWWTLGILIYEMLVGNPPFVDEDPMGIYQKILAGKIQFPRFVDKHAKDLIKRLLTADITKRLGNLKRGVEDVRKHKWFVGLDWTELYNRSIESPYRPKVADEADTSNFEEYPESNDENTRPVYLDPDPFADF